MMLFSLSAGTRLSLSALLVGLATSISLHAKDPFVTEGLAVSQAVTPGLIQFPMMAVFDDRGALYVAENAGVNLDKAGLLKEHPSSIKKLVDTDGDGVFDKVTVFADNMTFPQGALWVNDSLYVMSPPSLWRLEDTNGDGRADVREELVTGFDFTGNAADVHGPFLHPNGRIYWCHGRKGFVIKDNDTGQVMETGKSARIWSSQLSGGEVEWHSAGGMDNPVEIDFTDEGEIVGSVNLFYGRPRGDVLVHWVHGGVYPRVDQGQVLAELPRTGPLLPHAHNFGHVAVSGMCRYRSGSLVPGWKDGWLVTHFNTGEITLTTLPAKGSSYTDGTTETIFRVFKPDTHFTDVLEDPNGDLLVIDTGGWFRNGCPTSQIAKPEVVGTIYRISQKGKPYTKPTFPNWDKLTSEQVSHHLSAPEAWLRDRAITELAVRGAPAFPELERILADKESLPIARMGAIWTLARMKFSDSADMIYATLKDGDARVRQTACNAIAVTRSWQSVAAHQPAERLIELARNKTISGALAAIVEGDEPAVARAAAAALGRMGEARAVGSLTGRLGRAEDDLFLKHALIYALMEIDDFPKTKEGLGIENPAVITGILRALDGMASSKLEVLDILPFLGSDDTALRETAISIAASHPAWDAALANAFFSWQKEIDAKRQEILEKIIPDFAAAPPMLDFLTSLVTDSEMKNRILGANLIAHSPGMPFQKEWSEPFAAGLQVDADPVYRDAVLAALRISHSDAFVAQLTEICMEKGNTPLVRLAAAEDLATPNQPLPDPVIDLTAEIFESSDLADLRGRSLAVLSQAALSPAQRDRILGLLPNFGPLDWPAFPSLFKKFDSPEQAASVLKTLSNASMLEAFDAEALEKKFAFDPQVLTDLQAKIAELAQTKEGKKAAIESAIAEMDKADPTAGELVFSSGKGACVACHQVGKIGGKIGPNLSTIGRIRTAQDLYESVFFPSESIARDFDTYEVILKSKIVKTGLISEQTGQGVHLVTAIGADEFIPHREIASLRRLTTSLMPGGLDQALSPEDLRNLIAWLLMHK